MYSVTDSNGNAVSACGACHYMQVWVTAFCCECNSHATVSVD